MPVERVKTIDDYLASIAEDQKPYFENIRAAIKKSIDPNFEECISYGMLGYVVPFSVYPEGYHCDPKLPLPFANLAAQKNSINLYHMGIYGSPELLKWFQEEYAKVCKYRLDMGKACIRFKKNDDIPYQLISDLFSKVSANEYVANVVKTLKK